jgi:SAM-dependent methyltransferase
VLASDAEDLISTCCNADLSLQIDELEQTRFVIRGSLRCTRCGATFPVRNGIPRFLDRVDGYNPTWNYKWTAIDRGRGINYRILDKQDPAYELHDLYDRNSHEGRAFVRMRNGRALEIGCGVGQYVLKSLLEHGPARIVALDLTEGVDTLRRVLTERHPQLLERVLIVQASVFAMPFRPASFDYVYSLGVLHHTGNTEGAILEATKLLREGGELNVWVYAAASYPVDTREPGREHLSDWSALLRIAYVRFQARAWYSLFKRLSPPQADRFLRLFSSDLWYAAATTPVLRLVTRLVMSPPPHPDRDYRHINLFDGYVNAWAENWSEAEVFRIFSRAGLAVKGVSTWRLGMWGVKDSGFYGDGRG